MSGYQLSQPTNEAYGTREHAPVKISSLASSVFTHIVLFITVFLAWYWVIHYGNADPDGPGGLGPDFAVSPGWKYVYHPALMVTGFVLFMGEAIIAYRILPYDHATQKVIHLTLHTIALIFSSVGIWGMIMFHQDKQMRHFYNMHGFLGITGYSLFCVQYLFSVITFFAVDVPAPRAFAMPYHKYLGIVIFFFVWGALFSGVIDRQRIQFGDSEQTPNYKLSNALGAFIALSAACLLYHFSPASRAGNKDGGESERLL